MNTINLDDNIFASTPITAVVPELAREIERMRLDAGLDTAELLAALREERAKYYAEKYAGNSEDDARRK